MSGNTSLKAVTYAVVAVLMAVAVVPAQAQMGRSTSPATPPTGSSRGAEGIDAGTNVYPGSSAGTSSRPVESWDSRGGAKTDSRANPNTSRGSTTGTTGGAVNLNGPAGSGNSHGTTGAGSSGSR